MPTPFEQSVTFLYASCLESTHVFYSERLGLEMVLDQGPCRIYQVSPDAFVGFCNHRTPTTRDGVIITLVHRDIEALYERLKERGIQFEVPLRYNEGFHITQAFFRDPDGHLLELQRFESSKWPGSATP